MTPTFSVSSWTRHFRTHCSKAFLLDFHSSSTFLRLWLNVSKVLSILKQAALVACLLLISARELASRRRSNNNWPLLSVCIDNSSKPRRNSWCSWIKDLDKVLSLESTACPSCSSTKLILWENYTGKKDWWIRNAYHDTLSQKKSFHLKNSNFYIDIHVFYNTK